MRCQNERPIESKNDQGSSSPFTGYQLFDSDDSRSKGRSGFWLGAYLWRADETVERASQTQRKAFPPDFLFQLTAEEADSLRSQFATLKGGRGQPRKFLPYAFIKNGAVMAANVLNSPAAVRMSVFVVRAFVQMRDLLGGTKELAKQLADLGQKLTARLDGHEGAIVDVLQRLMQILDPPPPPPEPAAPKRWIGFNADQDKKPVTRARKKA